MDEFLDNIPMTISIIDYIGKIENGVALLINMVVDEQSYEIAYWYNREGLIRLVPEEKLLKKLNVSNIYEYDKINEFVYFIHHNIPNTDKILDEFLNDK